MLEYLLKFLTQPEILGIIYFLQGVEENINQKMDLEFLEVIHLNLHV